MSKSRLAAALLLVMMNMRGDQPALRDVSGRVLDLRGNVLPASTVQVENTVNLTVRSYVTGPDGQYRFNGLNDDIDYVLKAHYRDKWSKPKTLNKFNTNPHPEIDLIIPVE